MMVQIVRVVIVVNFTLIVGVILVRNRFMVVCSDISSDINHQIVATIFKSNSNHLQTSIATLCHSELHTGNFTDN